MAQSGRSQANRKQLRWIVHSNLNRLPTAGRLCCLCRASCFRRLLSSYRCCRSSRRLITGRRHAGTATASYRAIISPRITAFQLTPRKLRFRAWSAATGARGISIQSQVITGTMATGTISAGLAFTAVATMAAALALAGRGRRSADLELRLIKLLPKDRARVHPFSGNGGWRRILLKKDFQSSAKKDFFNTIGALPTLPPPVHFERRTPQFKPQPQRPRLAGGGRSHSCRNLDCERPAGHVGLLPPLAPTAYNARVVPV